MAAEGRVESVIFRYCSLARLRITFKSLTGIEGEADASSFCPGQTNRGQFKFLATFQVKAFLSLIGKLGKKVEHITALGLNFGLKVFN